VLVIYFSDAIIQRVRSLEFRVLVLLRVYCWNARSSYLLPQLGQSPAWWARPSRENLAVIGVDIDAAIDAVSLSFGKGGIVQCYIHVAEEFANVIRG
jgi:hypothetical protein